MRWLSPDERRAIYWTIFILLLTFGALLACFGRIPVWLLPQASTDSTNVFFVDSQHASGYV